MPMPRDLLIRAIFDISFFVIVSKANQSVFKGLHAFPSMAVTHLKLITGYLSSVVPPNDSCIYILSFW